MNSTQYHDYKILKSIEQRADVSQRVISKDTGINVASVNFALKRLVQRGYIKITNMNKKRIVYHLTPSGISQKAILAYNCFLRHYHLFSEIRETVSLGFGEYSNLENKNIAIFGLNEITEIIFFSMKERGVRFAGIFEDDEKLIGTKWLDETVQPVHQFKPENNGKIDYWIDVKTAAGNILNLKLLTMDEFLQRQKRDNQVILPSDESSKYRINICGAADTVTGSSILLKAGGKNILVDCGIAQGNKEESGKSNNHFPFDPAEINYLFLTHAHIDHSGRLYELIDKGFKGEIVCHHATVDLIPVLLKDSFKLNGYNTLNSPSEKGQRGALNHEELAKKAAELCWGFEYNQWNRISKNIRFKLLDAGHILGSMTVQFDICGEYLVFSGDIGNRNTGIIKDPVVPDRADVLTMEATYGGSNHGEINKADRFKEIIKKALKDNGKVLIPAFAVGRTQEIIYQLNDLVEKGEIENVPVFIDSPMGRTITGIYRKHEECFDEETLRRLKSGDDPLDFKKLFDVEYYSDSIQINSLKGPAIIIAGSGMCTGGRIVEHIINLIEDKTTDIIFVGYQAAGTPGADILRFCNRENGYVVLNGEKVAIKAGVHKLSGFSAHADHEDLINWVDAIKHKPHTILLNHGEREAQEKLKAGLMEKFEGIAVFCGYEKHEGMHPFK